MRNENSAARGVALTLLVIAFIVGCVFIWSEPTPTADMNAESMFTQGNITNLEWQAMEAKKEADRQRKAKATADLLEALGNIAVAIGDDD